MKLFFNSAERTPLIPQKKAQQQALVESRRGITCRQGFFVLSSYDFVDIFSYLCARDLVQLMLVNRYLKSIAEMEELWKNLYFCDFPDFRVVNKDIQWRKRYIEQRIKLMTLIESAELPPAVKGLLNQRGLCFDLQFGAIQLTATNLLSLFHYRPVIHGFVRRPESLQIIYQHINLSFKERLLQPLNAALISLLCNQVKLFTQRDCTPFKIALFKANSLVKLFHYACWLGYAAIAKHLMMVAKVKPTLMHLELATVEGHYAVVELLLKQGVQPIVSANTISWTLHGAARFLDYKMVDLYLEYKADAKKADRTGENAEDCLQRLRPAKPCQNDDDDEPNEGVSSMQMGHRSPSPTFI